MSKGAEFTIKAQYAALIQPFISKEETRYYLNGFFVQKHPREGVFFLAAGDHLLGVFHDETGECKVPGIVKLSKTTIAACEDDDEGKLTLALDGDTATVYDCREPDTRKVVAAQESVVIDGTFPDWRRVIPLMPNQFGPATFNFEFVKRFQKIRPSHSKTAQIRVVSRDAADPAIVFTGRRDFLGVIMPMRGDAETFPSWLPPIAMAAE